MGGWVYDMLHLIGRKIGAIALCALPVALAWVVLSSTLGRTQERRASLPVDRALGDPP